MLFAGLLMACDFVAALPGVQDSAAPAKASASADDAERTPAAIVKAPTAAELLRSCPLESVALADLRKLLDQGEFAKVDATLDYAARRLSKERRPARCTCGTPWSSSATLDFALLDRWAEARPDSWGAFTARGRRWIDAGYAHRGTALAKDVTEAQWAAMRDAFARAEIDLMRALEIEPDGYVAYGYRDLHAEVIREIPTRFEKWLDSLIARDPYNFGVRWNAMNSLSPYWGGSIEEMRQVATDAQRFADGNPRLRKLPGYAEAEAAGHRLARQALPGSRAGLPRALAHGADSKWYAQLADCLAEMGAWRKSSRPATSGSPISATLARRGCGGDARARSSAISPERWSISTRRTRGRREDAFTLRLRGLVRMRSGRLPEAAEDFRLALEIEPGNAWAIEQLQALGAARRPVSARPGDNGEGYVRPAAPGRPKASGPLAPRSQATGPIGGSHDFGHRSLPAPLRPPGSFDCWRRPRGWVAPALDRASSRCCLAAGATYSWIRLRNELVALDVAVDTQWKQVENQLERQHDLLPKLAAVARRYAAHEAGVFEKLAAARAAYAGASADAKPRLAGEVDGVLANVLALAESYPDLKADQQFRDLSYEIAGSQNRIALERQRYNEIVGLLNARLRQMPWSLVAGGFESASFYEAPREQLGDPDLEL